MATYTQASRHMSVKFANLGADDLLLQHFSGEEYVSKLFRFEVELLATSTTTIAFDNVLGQGVTVTILMAGGAKRGYFNGIVSRFSQGPQVSSTQGTGTFTLYRAEVVPQLWLLTRNHQSRIFQKQKVTAILATVLTGVTTNDQTQGSYQPRDFCVQYRETDFDFASRLMEEEGIFYYFTHSDGAHTMVLADTQASFADVPGPTTLVYETIEGGTRTDDRVHRWEKSQVIRSGKYRLWDYCFAKPTTNFEAVQPTVASVAVGTVTHKLKLGANSNLEIYDYPALYAQRFDGVDAPAADITTDSTRTVGIRMEEETAASVLVQGSSTCRQLGSGGKFTLSKHFNGNGDYILTGVQHAASAGAAYTVGDDDALPYTNTFECIPAALTFRPARTTPRPTIEGTQTAVVVGNSGDEILTDKYSRIKVQFPWDRQGQNNADSSCWIRVATPWAGTQWGIVHIPRVGQEVVVAFEEGDPDRPIIVGSVYNFNEMPPYTLVDNMTQSGYLSRSTKSGTSDNFNQLRFEDKKGSEEVYLHAEKDLNGVVENNETRKIGYDKTDKGDQTIQIYNNRSLTVGGGQSQADDGSETISVFNNQNITVGNSQAKSGSQTITVYKDRTETVQTGNETVTIEQGNRTHTIKTGNEALEVSTGNRTVTVDTGNDTHEIKMGNREVKIDMGNDALTISMGNHTTKVSLGASSTEAMQSITLQVMGNSIKIDPTGITLQGIMVTINGQAQAQVSAPMVQVSGDAMVQISGGITMIG